MASPLRDPDLSQFKYDAEFHKGVVINTDCRNEKEAWKTGSTLGREYDTYFLHSSKGPGKKSYRMVKRTYENSLKRELAPLIALREHPDFFAKFLGWYSNQREGTIWIAMEYLSGGDLQSYVEKDEVRAKEHCREVVTQILKALEAMHAMDLCHRDLKSSNIHISSISPLSVKLSGFDITACTEPSADVYTKAADMWNLGVLTHVMFTGTIPFPNPGRPASFPEHHLIEACAPDMLVSFIKQIMGYDPALVKPLSASDALQHPWIDPTPVKISKGGNYSTYKYDASFDKNTVTHTINGDTEVWRRDKRLGDGGFGEVFRHIKVSNKQEFRAVKSIQRSVYQNDKKSIRRELNTLIAMLKYRDLFVEVYGWYEDDEKAVFIAMEYLPEGDLHAYMLQDKNVLVASIVPLKLKLSDFGLAKSTIQSASLMKTMIGSKNYMAPEMLGIGTLTEGHYTDAVDMWALGTLTYEIFTGLPPFCIKQDWGDDDDDDDDEDDEDDDNDNGGDGGTAYFTALTSPQVNLSWGGLDQYCRGSRNSDFPSRPLSAASAPRTLVDFLFWLLRPAPHERLSAFVALQHPFIRGRDFDNGPSWTKKQFNPEDMDRPERYKFGR
ncbi:uncharacterized protein LAJ45_01213 [Morchella importuna]|uniref:uncharacterized protein n=1 Tax=Morchella importuna TaxID=1174673 RepID=UPI001E8E40B8|nr:uncharacterized protein LAJ45_01213 [Morchella importuna]KAH8154682.1 hypothetical protein LAJ45_01213 [Morchella importuna]